MRALSTETRDPLLAKFAQMRYVCLPSPKQSLGSMFTLFSSRRICNLLTRWIETYRHDFGAPGTAGALGALLKQIVSNVHLIHYGSELLPFLDQSKEEVDVETFWCKTDPQFEEDSDKEDSEEDLARDIRVAREPISVTSSAPIGDADSLEGQSASDPKGKRKASTVGYPLAEPSGNRTRASTGVSSSNLPGQYAYGTGAAGAGTTTSPPSGFQNPARPPQDPREAAINVQGEERFRNLFVEPRKLLRVVGGILQNDPVHIAQEITRKMAIMFVAIEVSRLLVFSQGLVLNVFDSLEIGYGML